MNDIPSLYELSLNVVAECFRIGIPPTNHVSVVPKVHGEIFENVMRIRDYCYNEHTKALIEKFRPKKLNLNFGNMHEGTFDEIKELELTELKIENFESISKYRVPKLEQGGSTEPLYYKFCIGRFLNDILSRETKEGLRVLNIGGWMSFGENWMEELSSMFPNLDDLDICCRKMCLTDFTSLCSNFPYLRTLDISNTEIENLDGLAKLQNMECLTIRSLSFETKEDINDLFELKMLKKLTIGGYSHEWNYDWFFEKPHQELETLVCWWPDADDAFLRRIIPKLPRLHTVVAYETRITRAAVIPGVSVYLGESIENMIKTIGYFRTQSNWEEVRLALEYFIFTRRWTDNRWMDFGVDISPEQMTSIVNELKAVIHVFKLGYQCLPDIVRRFLRMLTDLSIGSQIHSNIVKQNVLNMFAMDLENHLKKRTYPNTDIFKLLVVGLEALVKTTENLNVNKLCSLAMKSIIHGYGYCDWECSCTVILDTLMDQMDLSSEYYKTVNFRKLHRSLIIMQNNTNFLPERRVTAGKVLRFVELFM
ncbi:unnamed protein product [Caenorhabditis brenneri]